MKEFIDKLNEKLTYLLNNFGEHCEEWGSDKEGDCHGKSCSDCVLTHAIEIVNELAEEYKLFGNSEQVKVSEMPTGWIPCSINKHNKINVAEKMWVTMHNKESKYFFVRRLMWNGCLRRWEWDNGKPISDMWEVVAWKKIDVPAPYTEGE